MDGHNVTPGRCEPFGFDPGFDYTELRRALNDAGYNQFALSALAESTKRSDGRFDRNLARRRTGGPGRLNTFLRLFLLGLEVEPKEVEEALAPITLAPLVDSRVLAVGPGGISSSCMLMSAEDLLIPCDFDPRFAGVALQPDCVMGITQSSLMLAQLGLRRPVEAALDLGTGSGFHALLASRHARRVVATDLNRRALAFAKFAMRLNGVRSLELREGNLFEPVRDEHFGWITVNPPFVISPNPRIVYRDSVLPADELSREMLLGSYHHLSEGGFAALILNWAHPGESAWEEPPRSWLDGLGCDAWIMRLEAMDALGYAHTWLYEGVSRADQDHERELDEWLAYLRGLGIEHVTLGAVILRRRAAPRHWIRCESEIKGWDSGPRGGQIERIFAGEDLLIQIEDDATLFEQCLALAPELRLITAYAVEQGRWSLCHRALQLTGGFGFTTGIDETVAGLLACWDDSRPVRFAVEAIARRIGKSVEDIKTPCCTVIRGLLKGGYLSATPYPADGCGH